MEAQDFEMPSPKRQRTDSPEIEKGANEATATDPAAFGSSEQNKTVTGQDATADTDMLDFLMQHVEAESGSAGSQHTVQNAVPVQTAPLLESSDTAMIVEEESSKNDVPQTLSSVPEPDLSFKSREMGFVAPSTTATPPGLVATDPAIVEQVNAVAELEKVPATAETLLQERVPNTTADAPTGDEQQREWETDSSFDSSDDSTDTSSDSDSDSEAGDDYTLLDPLEQARILMAEDGGAGADSDDEGGARAARNAASNLRTQNEQAEAVPPIPNITVTEDMHIEELGNIEAIVENNVLIRAKTSGSYQVLEGGSVLCLADRKVVGAIAETLGRVEEPLYTMRFASQADMAESGVAEKGTTVFYVKDHSTFVFTQPLKAVKGSDASNLHDEEIGADEMEFSDDEAELEYKRMLKAKRKGIDPSTSNDRGRGSRGRGRGNRGTYQQNSHQETRTNDSMDMNYDDVEEGETDYTPLRRPDMNNQNQVPPHSRSSHNDRGGGRGRGRGGRGRGRGGNQNNRYDLTSSTNTNSMYGQPQGQYYPAQQQMPQPSYFGYQMPPPPQLTPSGGYPGNSIPPSPMIPLPASAGNYNFNFAAAAQSQWQQYHQNQNTQFQQQFTGQINADAIAQVQRQLEQMQKQAGQGGWPPQQ